MERLIVDRVCATIFPTGDAAATAEGRAAMALIAAHPELFEIGNHTQNHCNLRDGGGGAACPADPPTDAQIQAELLDADALFSSLAAKTGVPYWRPPYGAHDARVRAAAAAIDYTKTIMWDIDTIDWRPTADGGPTAGSMITKVTTNARHRVDRAHAPRRVSHVRRAPGDGVATPRRGTAAVDDQRAPARRLQGPGFRPRRRRRAPALHGEASTRPWPAGLRAGPGREAGDRRRS